MSLSLTWVLLDTVERHSWVILLNSFMSFQLSWTYFDFLTSWFFNNNTLFHSLLHVSAECFIWVGLPYSHSPSLKHALRFIGIRHRHSVPRGHLWGTAVDRSMVFSSIKVNQIPFSFFLNSYQKNVLRNSWCSDIPYLILIHVNFNLRRQLCEWCF